ncbi:hypothetical protein GS448_25915 [Rhodococcus hoagii]|nr:hypothetical protein [Prescottella equi]
MATGPDAARSQRRALEKLIVLDAAAAAEDLPLVSALTASRTSACRTRKH